MSILERIKSGNLDLAPFSQMITTTDMPSETEIPQNIIDNKYSFNIVSVSNINHDRTTTSSISSYLSTTTDRPTEINQKETYIVYLFVFEALLLLIIIILLSICVQQVLNIVLYFFEIDSTTLIFYKLFLISDLRRKKREKVARQKKMIVPKNQLPYLNQPPHLNQPLHLS